MHFWCDLQIIAGNRRVVCDVWIYSYRTMYLHYKPVDLWNTWPPNHTSWATLKLMEDRCVSALAWDNWFFQIKDFTLIGDCKLKGTLKQSRFCLPQTTSFYTLQPAIMIVFPLISIPAVKFTECRSCCHTWIPLCRRAQIKSGLQYYKSVYRGTYDVISW